MEQLYLTFNVIFLHVFTVIFHGLMEKIYLKLIVSLFEDNLRYLYKILRILIPNNQC